MVFSSAFSAMRARKPTSWFTSFTWAYACAVRVACLTAPLAYSSWIATVRSALSIEMRVIRAAASNEAAANWDSGFTGVGMGAAPFKAMGGVFGAPQQFHSRKRAEGCQGDFGALHHPVAPAAHQHPQM